MACGPGFASRVACLLLVVVALSVAPGLPSAQEEPRNRLPDGVLIDPETDPAPFDVLAAIRAHLHSRIATGWWIGEPERTANTFSVRVHVPVEWRGNPVSAMLSLCPDPGDPIWEHMPTLDLQPLYQNRPWAAVTCWR
ncbi:hypothetical protein ACUSIJ_21875 [Pseudochelatococcus sp. B33]